MRIGIIGGAERAEPQFKRLANQAGHEVEFHRGHMSGGSGSLDALVRRCDLVLITTDVNSHGAVRGAREVARAKGMAPVILRRLGLGRFGELLATLNHEKSTDARPHHPLDTTQRPRSDRHIPSHHRRLQGA